MASSKAVSKSEKSAKTTKTRGKLWPDDATKCLIQLWSEEAIQISLDTCKSSRQTSNVYKTLLNQLEAKGFEGHTLKEVINKIKKLRQKFKEEKDKMRRSGNGTKKKWKFFDAIDTFLSNRHNETPPVLVDTMAIDMAKSEEVEDMVKKYGEGETSTRKCTTCDYEQEIRSGGVHVSESGSVSVYSSEDDFHCPNCDSTESELLPEAKKQAEVEQDDDAPTDDAAAKKDDDASKDDVAAKNEKLCSSIPKSDSNKEKVSDLPKKKKKNNVEKSLEVIFDKFKQSSAVEFERYQRLEDERIKREQEFRIQQLQLESTRRKEDREHELNMLRMIMSSQQHVPMQQHAPHLVPIQSIHQPFNFPIVYGHQSSTNAGNDSNDYPTNDDATFFKL